MRRTVCRFALRWCGHLGHFRWDYQPQRACSANTCQVVDSSGDWHEPLQLLVRHRRRAVHQVVTQVDYQGLTLLREAEPVQPA